tara:strand:- start:535 stop:768 length:234 start_codon:yes stop_codon:yes gene_type:complete
MVKKSCPECFSQKQYCEECSFFNEEEEIAKCSNFKNCGNSWTEDYDNAYRFCSQKCKDFYTKNSFLFALANRKNKND